jgi:hypothetical protein
MLRTKSWLCMVIAAACCGACTKSSGQEAAGSGGSSACQVACDAGVTMHDAARPEDSAHHSGPPDSGPPAPMGHPAPANSKGCAPEGPDGDGLGTSRVVLYTGPRKLAQVSARSHGVIVADSADGLLRMNMDGNGFVRIAQVPMVATFLAADLSVYWAKGSAIYKASIDASDAMPAMVAGGVLRGAEFLSYDEKNLYFADDGAGSIWQQPLAGTAPVSLDSAIAAEDMKLFAGHLYYSDLYSQRVYRVPVGGGDAESLAVGMQGSVQAVAADIDTLYWVDDTQIQSTPIGSPSEATTIGQGGAAPLGRGRVMSMKLVEDRLYWADDVFDIGWTATDGSACGLVVKALPGVSGWDADETAVYVTLPVGAGSELWRIGR